MPADYFGEEFANLSAHSSGIVQVIAAPSAGHIVIDWFLVSNSAASTIHLQSDTGGTDDVDLFTINLGAAGAFYAGPVKIKLGNNHSLFINVNTGTFSVAVGYHIEQ